MLIQFILGGLISILNIAIHSFAMVFVIKVARAASAGEPSHPYVGLSAVMIPTVLCLMIVHAAEVIVWGGCYGLIDAAPPGANPVYFAFVNYTTLGYGDILPVERWEILGPMTAMNGVLLFGWSTAVIFEVLRRVLARLDADCAAR
jgi:hypothetical protein